MLVRPSLVLQVMLTPDVYSEQTAEEIKRSYVYLAQPLVKQLSLEDADQGNVMRLSVRLMRPAWDTSDSKACELWDGVMPHWLRNIVRNMSIAMHNYNTVDHPEGCTNIHYDWVDFDFSPNIIARFKTDDGNGITSTAPAVIDAIRQLLNEHAFGTGDIAMIRVPSLASYERQLEEAKRQNLELANEQAGEQEEQDAEPTEASVSSSASQSGNEPQGPDPEADSAAAESGDSSESEAGQDAGDAPSSDYGQPAFDIDFSIWGIEYADGTVIEFDSRTA